MLMTRSVSSTSSRSARAEFLKRGWPRRRCVSELAIQQPGEGLQALLVLRLLEQRPAVLVETLGVEARTSRPRAITRLIGAVCASG